MLQLALMTDHVVRTEDVPQEVDVILKITNCFFNFVFLSRILLRLLC